MDWTITEASFDDCASLADFAAKSFTDTFGHLYRPENLAAYLLSHTSVARFQQTLEEGDKVLLLSSGERLIGYAQAGKLLLPLPTAPPPGAQELQRLYLDRSVQGQGLGAKLLTAALVLPQMRNAPVLYLGVWEENWRAQKLYKAHGFQEIGDYPYPVGDQIDRELIYARPSL